MKTVFFLLLAATLLSCGGDFSALQVPFPESLSSVRQASPMTENQPCISDDALMHLNPCEP